MSSSKISIVTGILMQKVKNSDQKAFRDLYDILWKPLYIRVYSILRNRQMSEDILQEVWIDLWQRRKDIENENIEAYLFRAVRFKAYNHYRNTNTRRTILQNLLARRENIQSNNVEDSLNLKETENAVMKSIDTLPPKCKKVFELSRFEGLKNAEISQKLNISKSTVENHISNALKVLKTRMASLILTTLFFLLHS